VVDDDTAIREALQVALELRGYRVEVADDGAAALSVADRVQPALVLLDSRMPTLDGPGFVRALRERGLDLPIVAMTGSVDAEEWARRIGAVGLLPKPFSIGALLNLVARLAERRAG
jgi:CheY-like chemotaxis protein